MKKYLVIIVVVFLCIGVNKTYSETPSTVYISEIVYDSPLNEYKYSTSNAYHNNGEYIKLYNPTQQYCDLSGWILLGTNIWEQFCFPEGTFIEPNGVIIIAYKNDPSYNFSSSYNTVGIKVVYQSSIILSNDGEHLELIDNMFRTVDRVSYGNQSMTQNKVLYADNSDQGFFSNVKSLKRTDVYYENGVRVDRGKDDFTYDVANPSQKGFANSSQPSINQTTNTPTIAYSHSFASPLIWFKTASVSVDNRNYYYWRDFSGNGTILRKYDPRGAGYGDEYIIPESHSKDFNFNPALNLSFQQVTKRILNTKSNLSQTTIIGAWCPSENNTLTTDNFMFSIKGKQTESILFTKNKIIADTSAKRTNLNFGQQGNGNFILDPQTTETDINFKEKSIKIGAYYRSNKPDHSLWGEPKKSCISVGYYDLDNPTFNGNISNYPGYDGSTPELLIFNKILNKKEFAIYQTYLALKYGISLDTSYVAPNGRIMWNINENTKYNNRITGYTRQDALSFYQANSTTSYEEYPNYSYLEANNCYDNNDRYGLPSRNKLLIVGKQPACPFEDGEYYIFGDNDSTLTIPTSNNIPDFRALARRWLIKTGTKPDVAKQYLVWNSFSISCVSSYSKTSFTKLATVQSGGAVTSSPLKNKNGYFSFILNSKTAGSVIYLKFGLQKYYLTNNSNDYGYKIGSDGKVYKIERGIVSSSYFAVAGIGQKIEVEKIGNLIFLRINGYRLRESEYQITNSKDLVATYYGAINIEGTTSLTLDLKHGGFVDTGHKVEISYNIASLLATNKQNVCLIIDGAGSGNFKRDSTRVYNVDEIDIVRSKLIFNNVDWNLDGNTKDIFTFGFFNATSQGVKKENDISTPKEPRKLNYTIVFNKNPNDLSLITIKVYLANNEPYTIFVDDITGRRIFKKDCLGSEEEQYTDIQLPYSGFYLVRVISKSYHYNKKIVSN